MGDGGNHMTNQRNPSYQHQHHANSYQLKTTSPLSLRGHVEITNNSYSFNLLFHFLFIYYDCLVHRACCTSLRCAQKELRKRCIIISSLYAPPALMCIVRGMQSCMKTVAL